MFEIAVERTVGADPQACWDAWTKPEHLDKWFTSGAVADLRVGGRYKNADNDTGEYLVVEEPTKLRFTWEQKMHEPGSEVEVTLEPRGDKTKMTLTHSKLAKKEEAEELLSGGWEWALDSLKSYLEAGKGVRYEDWRAQQGKQGLSESD
jgi:uncharacterized protein YndB with AHSA1/START domain